MLNNVFKEFCERGEGGYSCYRHRLCKVREPFWFSMERRWAELMPFSFSTDDSMPWIIASLLLQGNI